MIAEDQAEGYGHIGEEARELGIEGEIFEDGEISLDVLRQRNLDRKSVV